MQNNVEIPKFYKEPKREYKRETRLYNAGFCVFYDYYGSDVTPLVAARMSTGNPSGIDVSKDSGSRNFLWRHGHVSPFEQAGVSVVIQVPIAVARQVLRHKGLHVNEYSMRYSEPLHEYYVPEPEDICYDNEHNKQSSGKPVDENLAQLFINEAKDNKILEFVRYEKYRKMGIAKERVRDFQPVSAYTRIMITANLRDWFFYLHKRLKPGTQVETRKLSWAIYEIIKDLFPLCSEVFEEYTLYGENVSKTEITVLKEWMEMLPHLEDPSNEAVFDNLCQKNGLNKSRTRELKEKFKLFHKE